MIDYDKMLQENYFNAQEMRLMILVGLEQATHGFDYVLELYGTAIGVEKHRNEQLMQYVKECKAQLKELNKERVDLVKARFEQTKE